MATRADARPSAGAQHGAAVKADGTVIAWGGYWLDGQTNVPAGLSNVVALSAAANYNLAIAAQSTLPGATLLTVSPLGPTAATALGATGINDASALAWLLPRSRNRQARRAGIATPREHI